MLSISALAAAPGLPKSKRRKLNAIDRPILLPDLRRRLRTDVQALPLCVSAWEVRALHDGIREAVSTLARLRGSEDRRALRQPIGDAVETMIDLLNDTGPDPEIEECHDAEDDRADDEDGADAAPDGNCDLEDDVGERDHG